MAKLPYKGNRYQVLIEKVFFDHYKAGAAKVFFERSELISAAKKLRSNCQRILATPFTQCAIALQCRQEFWRLSLMVTNGL